MKVFFLPFLIILFLFCSEQENNASNETEIFMLGNEVLLTENSSLISGKRIALITNASGVLSDGTLFLDALHQNNFNVVKIFGPEHGLRVDDKDYNHVDQVTGIPIISLYGAKKKPTSTDLDNIDIMIYDLQDVGARFYTFINTLYYCMESAIENNKKIIVADRPVIPNPDYVDGFILESDVKSFVGLLDIPIAYGMTIGELALFINAEMLNGRCDLEIIKMKNYLRSTDYTDLNLTWVKPSPNMYFPSTAVTYAGTCLFEGTNFAEGRGTDRPFEYVGAPYADGKKLADEMKSYGFFGVRFEPVTFTPTAITSPSNPPKYVGKVCEGVFINVTDKNSFEPVKAGIALLVSIKKLFPEFRFNEGGMIDKLSGTKNLKTMINNKNSYQEIINYYLSSLNNFKEKRKKYLLY
jgi:uncharacterized protein YbbC (DUF1343 family)